jgi:thioredoxin-related protein
MKRAFIFIFIFSCSAALIKAQGILFFHGSFAEAQAEAKKQHKLIFIDCYTVWCGPCNKMTRDVFPRQDVGDFYNAHFICCKMDMEKGEGLTIANSYSVKNYPTYLFLNDAGELAHRTLGSKEPALFIKDGEIAADPNRNLRGLATKFVNGDKDTALLKQLIPVSYYVEPELNERALTVYFDVIGDFRIIQAENWSIFKNYEEDIHSKAFQYVVNNKSDFVQKYGGQEVDNVLYSKISDAIRVAAENKDQSLFNEASGLMAGCKDEQINEKAGLNTLRFYRKTGQWDKYVRYADPFLAKHGKTQEIYNSVAWEIVANSDNIPALEKALVYSEKSMKIEKNYGNSDTWANVLYKLKRYKEAQVAAKESIALAKKEKLDDTSTKELLEKIEKALSQN